MELAILANFLLFLGSFAVKLTALDSAAAANEDPLYDEADYQNVQNGSGGDDLVSADHDNSAFFLGDGNDDLTASAGKDYTQLGSGDDQADMGAGDDIALGGAGADRLFGETGNDTLLGGLDNDSLAGGLGNDSLSGGDGADEIWGGTGADTLLGDIGNDSLSGFDPIKGGANGLIASDGVDFLGGGEGDDHLLLGRGDFAVGGAGNDVFEMDTRWSDGAGQFVIDDFQRGLDRLELTYTAVYDPATGAEIAPNLSVTLAPSGESSQILINGAVVATVNGVRDLALSDVELVPAVINDSSYDPGLYGTENFGTDVAGALTATGSTAHFAQGGDDQFTGSAFGDYADMGLGNDRADLGAGNDSALGGEGADRLSGDNGNDALRGGNGADSLFGDAGGDLLFGGAGADNMAGGVGNDSLDGGADNDTLFGDEGQDTLLGGLGGDSLDAGQGNDSLDGGDGNDLMSGGTGGDTILGGLGNDTISGFEAARSNPTSFGANEGNDLIYGGAGADHIWVGMGDSAYGGADNDLFLLDGIRYDANAIPRVEDFIAGDRIEIHYDLGVPAPVITLAASDVTGETDVLADGQIVARVVNGAAPLTTAFVTAVAR